MTPEACWYHAIRICIVFADQYFCSKDCIPFIFRIIPSVYMSYSCRPEYLWYPKRTTDGQVML